LRALIGILRLGFRFVHLQVLWESGTFCIPRSRL
jgi:hypothetical protein